MNSLSFNPHLRQNSLFHPFQSEGRLKNLVKNNLQRPKNDSFLRSSLKSIDQLNNAMLSRFSLMNQLKSVEAELGLKSRALEEEMQEEKPKQVETQETDKNGQEVSNDPFTKVADDFENLFLAAGFTADEANGFADLIASTLKSSQESGIEQLNISVTSIHSLQISQTSTRKTLQETEDGGSIYHEVSRTREFSALSMRSINISINTATGEMSVTAEKVNQVSVSMSRTEKTITALPEEEKSESNEALQGKADLPPFMEAYRTLFALLNKLMEGNETDNPFKQSLIKVREVMFERNIEQQQILRFTLDMLTPIDEEKEMIEKDDEAQTDTEQPSEDNAEAENIIDIVA